VLPTLFSAQIQTTAPDQLLQSQLTLSVVPKPGVRFPGARYANIHTEQSCFIAGLRKYGSLSPDSTPRSQIDSCLYASHDHLHLPNTHALLFS